MKILILLINFFLLTSCASWVSPDYKPRKLEDYYVSTGVEKYLLPEIPNWANFDQRASCFRSQNIRYFDLNALMKSYSLEYNTSLQMQAEFNSELFNFAQDYGGKKPNLKEEELIFYRVSDKISGRINFFEAPKYKRIHLIWIDEILESELGFKKLKKFLESSTSEKGAPVLVSFCLSKAEVEKRYPELASKMITAEMFSIFDSSGKRTPNFILEIDKFFDASQSIYFYSQKKISINEMLIGKITTENY
jgi:hypothetical protein